jgi:hypothetical protein
MIVIKKDIQRNVQASLSQTPMIKKIELSKDELKEVAENSKDTWIHNWAKQTTFANTNQLINLGLSSGATYDMMKNNSYNPSGEFDKLPDDLQLGRLYQLDGYFRYIMILMLSTKIKSADEIMEGFPAKFVKFKVPGYVEDYMRYFDVLILGNSNKLIKFIHGSLARLMCDIYMQDKTVGNFCTKWIIEQEQFSAQRDLRKLAELSAKNDNMSDDAGSDNIVSDLSSSEEGEEDVFDTKAHDLFDDAQQDAEETQAAPD